MKLLKVIGVTLSILYMTVSTLSHATNNIRYKKMLAETKEGCGALSRLNAAFYHCWYQAIKVTDFETQARPRKIYLIQMVQLLDGYNKGAIGHVEYDKTYEKLMSYYINEILPYEN